jgi:hypothetical protein
VRRVLYVRRAALVRCSARCGTPSPSHCTGAGGGPRLYLVRSARWETRLACRRWVVVAVADRLSTVTITCCVDGLAHEVTEEDVAAGRRCDDRRYRTVCGYRFVLPAPLVALTGRPCPRCAAVLVAARGPQPTAGQVRRPGDRQPGWWWVLRPGRGGGAGVRWWS